MPAALVEAVALSAVAKISAWVTNMLTSTPGFKAVLRMLHDSGREVTPALLEEFYGGEQNRGIGSCFLRAIADGKSDAMARHMKMALLAFLDARTESTQDGSE